MPGSKNTVWSTLNLKNKALLRNLRLGTSDPTEIANGFNDSFLIDSVDALTRNVQSVQLENDTITSDSSFYSKMTNQDTVHKVITNLSNSHAKDVFNLDTAFSLRTVNQTHKLDHSYKKFP